MDEIKEPEDYLVTVGSQRDAVHSVPHSLTSAPLVSSRPPMHAYTCITLSSDKRSQWTSGDVLILVMHEVWLCHVNVARIANLPTFQHG
jgi:hypothetical protein